VISKFAEEAAARQAGTPRSLDELTGVSRVDKDEIARTYRYIARELSLEIKASRPRAVRPRGSPPTWGSPTRPNVAPASCCRRPRRKGVHSGKSPVGLAAAGVYAASLLTNQKVTQSQVSEVANISEVTIRNRYHELLEADQQTQSIA